MQRSAKHLKVGLCSIFLIVSGYLLYYPCTSVTASNLLNISPPPDLDFGASPLLKLFSTKALQPRGNPTANLVMAQTNAQGSRVVESATESKYRPYLMRSFSTSTDGRDRSENEKGKISDWVDELELDSVQKIVQSLAPCRLKFLVLYGSLRERYCLLTRATRSYSQLMAYEAARILDLIGVDVRVFSPHGLPIKDESNISHPKVLELRSLSEWSDGHFWVSPEQHGNLVCFPLFRVFSHK